VVGAALARPNLSARFPQHFVELARSASRRPALSECRARDPDRARLLAFFEIPKGKEPAGNRNAIGAMQHCAFVVTAEHFREVEARLISYGIDYIGPIPQLPGLLGIYFYDPNGIRLECACQPEDGETPTVIRCITQTKAEARAELETLPGITPEWIEKRLAALPD
jgi:hypothetical protein